jgi:hypothetical protein
MEMNAKIGTSTVNQGALAGIEEISPANEPTIAELQAVIRRLELEKLAMKKAAVDRQLIDQHVKAANESRASTQERFAIMIDEARDTQEVDPVPVGCNGRLYQIKRGKIVEVPIEVIDNLNHAVEDKAVVKTDAQGNPAGYDVRKARRFPFQNYGKTVDAAGARTNLQLPVLDAAL